MGPVLLLTWALIAAVYLVGLVVDMVVPWFYQPTHPYLSADVLARTGFLEWRLLGGRGTWAFLPLADRPAVAVLFHVILWSTALLGLLPLVRKFAGMDGRPASLDRREAPFFFRWCGCSTTAGLDDSVRVWLKPFVWLLGVLALGAIWATAAGGGLALPSPACPAPTTEIAGGLVAALGALAGTPPPTVALPPGLLVLLALLVAVLLVHLAEGRPTLPAPEKREEPGPPAPIDPLARLRECLPVVAPGASIEPGESELPGRPELRGEWPRELPAPIIDAWRDGRGISAPYRNQAEVAARVQATYRLAGKRPTITLDAPAPPPVPGPVGTNPGGPEARGPRHPSGRRAVATGPSRTRPSSSAAPRARAGPPPSSWRRWCSTSSAARPPS